MIDKTLGIKGINTRYSYSNVIENLTSVFVSGGEVLEDVNFFRQEAFKENPDYRFCSADIIGRDLRGFAVENTEFQAVESGKTYQFNINDRLNGLLLKGLLELGMVEKDVPVIFDYDNQFIANEKYDATYSYKKANGYFPGIAQINLHPFYIENRDGNANVKFEQAETLERAFAHLKANGIKVDKARMDCGSYSQEVVEVASCNSNTFYIRAMGCQTLEKRIAEIKEKEWRNTEINNQECGLASLPFTAFFAERGYRLVVQRTLVQDKQSTLFDSYVYRCILTNDWESGEHEVVGVHDEAAGHRGEVVEVDHAQAGLDVALRDARRGVALLAGGLHQQILCLQVLHPILVAEGFHGQVCRVVLLGGVRRAGQADTNEFELSFRIARHHFVADGGRHGGVKSAGEA